MSEHQYGFQKGKSTEMAASKFINDVTIGLNNKQPTLAILLDFQAAFDTLWQKAIIYKMHKMGFDTNRKFAVQLNGKKSTIPQDGKLSAIFYLEYSIRMIFHK